jgi:ubiquinone/menaquinone biosynthesis C-methylase UbiE
MRANEDEFPLVNFFVERPRRLKVCRKAADLVQLREGLHLLEVGCANGSTSIFFAENYGCFVTGIDISYEMIKEANIRQKPGNIENRCNFIKADASQLPFINREFDIIYCEAVFSALTDKVRVAQEFKRVLKPKGKVVLVDFVLRRPVSEELQQKMDIPCFLGATQLEGYFKLFDQVNLISLYTEDVSEEIFKTGEYLAWALRCKERNLIHLSAKISHCYGSKNVTPSLIRRFLRDSKLSYYLLVFGD